MTGNFHRLVLLLFLMLTALRPVAQTEVNIKKANNGLNENQKSFAKLLDQTVMDGYGKSILLRFITEETDSLQKIADLSKTAQPEYAIMALDAQNNFLDTLQSEIRKKIFDINYTRIYIDRFKMIWKSIFTHQPYAEIMKPFKAKSAGMMAGVFRDYPQADQIKDLAILKSLETATEKITNFLSNNNRYRLADSLIFISGNTQPELFINFALLTKDEILSKAIREHKSPMIQTLLSISHEADLNSYIPFVLQLATKQLTLDDIKKTRTQPLRYYQLLVDAEISNRAKIRAGEVPLYVEPTRKYLKKYAIIFYTDIINRLHEESNENKRFFVLEDLRPQDLYYIITSGETDLYTSSYLYIYKKLMSMFPDDRSDSLFRLVKYDQYKKFLLMAGRYNTLSSFMKKMPGDTSLRIIRRMMNGLESNVVTGLEETINVAETFPGIVHDDYLSALTILEIKNNYTRCKNIPDPFGMKVYSLLEEIYHAVKNDDLINIDQLNPALKVYFKLKHSSLSTGKASINQLVLFYGDEDGRSSYASFLSNFTDGSTWSIEKNSLWVTIRSKNHFPISIYANLPLTDEGEADIKAQDSLINYLSGRQIESNILIHRGHSYHLPNSINHVTSSVRLAILGSCGGYSEIFELLKKSPEVQIISSKQVGSKLVNEPLLKLLNDQLLQEKDLVWADIWKQLDRQFEDNKQIFDYFKEYVPPYKNISLLVAALFTQAGIE